MLHDLDLLDKVLAVKFVKIVKDCCIESFNQARAGVHERDADIIYPYMLIPSMEASDSELEAAVWQQVTGPAENVSLASKTLLLEVLSKLYLHWNQIFYTDRAGSRMAHKRKQVNAMSLQEHPSACLLATFWL